MAVVIEKVEPAYQGWISVRRATLRDDKGARFTREVEAHGEGVAVLPYDPGRKVALVVRLPRAPVMLSGAGEHLIEAPAGLLDPGETPETAARREAFEEAGVELEALEPLGLIWTMPGISTERMSLFVGAYRAAGRTGAGGGLDEEHENITVQEMPLAALAALADEGRLTDMRTLTLLLHLRLRHPDLF